MTNLPRRKYMNSENRSPDEKVSATVDTLEESTNGHNEISDSKAQFEKSIFDQERRFDLTNKMEENDLGIRDLECGVAQNYSKNPIPLSESNDISTQKLNTCSLNQKSQNYSSSNENSHNRSTDFSKKNWKEALKSSNIKSYWNDANPNYSNNSTGPIESKKLSNSNASRTHQINDSETDFETENTLNKMHSKILKNSHISIDGDFNDNSSQNSRNLKAFSRNSEPESVCDNNSTNESTQSIRFLESDDEIEQKTQSPYLYIDRRSHKEFSLKDDCNRDFKNVPDDIRIAPHKKQKIFTTAEQKFKQGTDLDKSDDDNWKSIQAGNQISIEDFQRCILTRNLLARNLTKPFFHHVVGGFVRVNLNDGYMVMRIIDVYHQDDYIYEINGKSYISDIFLGVKHAGGIKKIPIFCVSNSPPQSYYEIPGIDEEKLDENEVVSTYNRICGLFNRPLTKEEENEYANEKRKSVFSKRQKICKYREKLWIKMSQARKESKEELYKELKEAHDYLELRSIDEIKSRVVKIIAKRFNLSLLDDIEPEETSIKQKL